MTSWFEHLPRISESFSSVYDSVLFRIRIIKNVIRELPHDIKEFLRWMNNRGRRFGSDWYCFTSSIFVASIPFISFLILYLFLLSIGVSNEVEDRTESAFEFLALFTGAALLGVIGLYTVRIWERIRNIILKPVKNNNNSNIDNPGNLGKKRSYIKKYKYWVWSLLSFCISVFILLLLEWRGIAVNEYTLPYKYPDFLGDFSGEMDTVWFIDGIRTLSSELTLGEAVIFSLVFLLPASFIAMGTKIHIDHVRDEVKNRSIVLNIFREVPKTILSLFILLVVNSIIFGGGM